MAKRKMLDSRNLRREAARKDGHYQTLLDLCDTDLKGPTSSFHKDDILVRAGLQLMARSIRWDYIAHFLTDPTDLYGHSLVAAAQSFFDDKVWAKTAATLTPVRAGRYTATGHGKRTAGYCLAELAGGRLLLYRTGIAVKTRNGTNTALRQRVKRHITDPAIDDQVRQEMASLSGVRMPKSVQ